MLLLQSLNGACFNLDESSVHNATRKTLMMSCSSLCTMKRRGTKHRWQEMRTANCASLPIHKPKHRAGLAIKNRRISAMKHICTSVHQTQAKPEFVRNCCDLEYTRNTASTYNSVEPNMIPLRECNKATCNRKIGPGNKTCKH